VHQRNAQRQTGRGQREIVTESLDTLLVYGAAIPYGVLRPDDSAMREIEDALYKVLLDKTSRFPVARARPAPTQSPRQIAASRYVGCMAAVATSPIVAVTMINESKP
jgi:hypothetical protein